MRPVTATDKPVLILAPAGRDAAVAGAILAEVGVAVRAVESLAALTEAIDRADCAVVTEEALLAADRTELAAWVQRQAPWSDFPFILLSLRGMPPDRRLPDLLGNVTLIERPFHPAVLVSAVHSALRARRRQREVEAHLEERQRTQERQSLLIRELHHRVKNTLAAVQGLFTATARSSASYDDFYRTFCDRIVSLSNTHTLLTEDYWQSASLLDLLRNELAPYDDGTSRILLQGPPVELTADLAVPTGMAIHELTTNAAKYGALSVEGGRIEVAWQVRMNGDGRRLALDWRELDGPPVQSPRKTGFGSTLLRRVLATQCHAEVSIDYDPQGVRFRMDAPLAGTRLVPQY